VLGELRESGKPYAVEALTYRLVPHGAADFLEKYRTKEEVETYKGKDPITNLLNVINTNNIATEAEIEEINKRVDAAVAESVKFAEESPFPSEDEVLKDVYVDQSYPFIVD